jgi:tetratricopeptide (TPR) repeat protein
MVGDDSHLKSRIAAAAAAILLIFAGCYSFRFAWADLLQSRADVASLRKAVSLTPLDSHARYIQAAVLAAANPSGNESDSPLRAAIALNPRNANAWMALGIQAESQGNTTEAEKCLLEAAAVDHTFKPAWTLANFYVRSGRTEKFWKWIRGGLEMVEPRNNELLTFDPQPMFDLCWNVTDDASLILERAIPHNPYVLLRYVSYLRSHGRWDAATRAAEPLFPIASTTALPTLLDLCDGLIANRRAADAVEVWNALARRKLISVTPLDPAGGISLTNGSLTSAPIKDGFDWTFPRPGGVYESYSAADHFVRLELDGEEPENCDLLTQWVPLEGGRRYRFESTYQTSGMEGAATGLAWTISGLGNGAIAAHDEAEGSPGKAELEFTTPLGLDLARVALRYDRVPGTTPPKGSFKLYGASLRLLP